MKLTRGFKGRGQATRDPRLPPGQYDTGRQWPVLTAEVDAEARPADVDVHRRGAGRAADHVDVGRDPRAPAVDLRRRHPLRHHVVEVRHALRAACRSTRCSRRPARCRRPRHVLAFSPTGYTTNLPLADVTGGKAWVVWDGRRPAAPARPRRARRGSWCRTSTSGRAPSGWRGSACSTTTSPASGSATATTTAATPGSSSATRATDRGRRRGRRRRCVAIRDETPTAKTFRLALGVPTGHRAGQHYVVRLTAPDGYTASRSYSVASAPDGGSEIELTVERLEDGEVSTFLHDVVEVGDELEVRGPIGGCFVWDGTEPALLLGGGSGLVPLMAMLRLARATGRDRPRAPRRVGAVARRPVLRGRAARVRTPPSSTPARRRRRRPVPPGASPRPTSNPTCAPMPPSTCADRRRSPTRSATSCSTSGCTPNG